MLNLTTFHIILPIGISFYTFKSMSYSIDIYRGEMEPTHKFFDYALFVSFFPALIAGPIDRAKNLFPQIQNERHVDKDQILGGLHLIFWGLFKKVFVADNLGIIVDQSTKTQPQQERNILLRRGLSLFKFMVIFLDTPI